ncbi:MAG: restriction endonuclease subunit S, partial [Oscillospiraceae bacterium]|nr:restriction endonuclease subunit S [Oscillospiraceae bacterium]
MGEWKKESLGNLCVLFNGDRGRNYPSDADIVAEGFPFINAGHLLNGKVDFSACDYITEHKFNSLRGAKLQYGDIIYCLRGTIGKNAFYSAAYSGTIASSLVAIRPENVDSLFLYQVLNSESEEKQRKMSDNGTAQPNLSADSVMKYTILMPNNIKEQQKIAEILKTVDTAIEKTRALIEKYKNIKAGLMQDLLTNGIDEHGNIRSPKTHEYKDSPFGEIPVEWDCIEFSAAIAHCFDYRGRTPKKLGMDWGGDIPALSANNVCMGYIDLEKPTYFGSESLYRKWMHHGDIQYGDIVFTMEAPLGNVAKIND